MRKLTAVFVKTIGMFEKRKGRLYNPCHQDAYKPTRCPRYAADYDEDAHHVAKSLLTGRRGESALRPLDILLEKTPFRRTDMFIPGHFGHVAIRTGAEAELRAIGAWDDPALARELKRKRWVTVARGDRGACVT